MIKVREKELKYAKGIIKQFCDANNIKVPKCRVQKLDKGLGVFKPSKPNFIFVDIEKCRVSNKRLNATFIKDKTICGVIIHEFAHYIHLNHHYSYLKNCFKRLKEPLIHYFESDIDEDIAESIRLFILNPTLLKEGRPKRYKILSRIFKQINVVHFTELFYHLPMENRYFIVEWIDGKC